MSTESSRASLLRKTSHTFCQAFLNNLPPAQILDRFFVPASGRITEHGPSWAQSRLPFLGQTFQGRAGCERYFAVLVEVLDFLPSEETFPGPEGMVVDAEANLSDEDRKGSSGGGKGVVHVKAKAKFRAKKTGKDWEEEFAYRLSGFDEEGKIGHWEIWADPLSAWVAVGGEDVSG